jgi:uncharacterized membrane protein YfcA
MVYVVLTIAALLASALSGMLGMGGGMLLLALMFSFLPYDEAIPLHGAVQFISNSTRTFAFLKHVDWRTVRHFLLGAVPGSVIGVGVLVAVGKAEGSEPYLKTLVGLYILASLVIPKPVSVDRAPSGRAFVLLGLAAGAAAFVVGAVGPLIAPLFARRDFVKERLVATKAICQTLLHAAKVPVFLALRSYPDLPALGALAIAMGVAVIPGTLIGKRLLKGLSERAFVRLYQVALLVAGLKVLIVDGVLAVARSG